jgi:hypothetical protein
LRIIEEQGITFVAVTDFLDLIATVTSEEQLSELLSKMSKKLMESPDLEYYTRREIADYAGISKKDLPNNDMLTIVSEELGYDVKEITVSGKPKQVKAYHKDVWASTTVNRLDYMPFEI